MIGEMRQPVFVATCNQKGIEQSETLYFAEGGVQPAPVAVV